ncbi:DUF3592 domain-containing protein [Paraburkholderia sp. BL25I1N1]|uniref:DUF3592 domain-containing protein n=1 Tax=Paraburkholderia sp. BL25I1N1 TaxID=1938804 RepID=UPI000D07908A|nr:DUF3592 domain-containing protein [Paraburkholderia sp. BL25I1N1]
MPIKEEKLNRISKNAIFFAGGVFLLVAADFLYSQTTDFINNSVVVSGKVTRLNHGGHHVQVEFDTQTGEHISSSQSAFISANVGDTLPIRYRPDDPTHTSEIDRFMDIWDLPFVCFALGMVFLCSILVDCLFWKRNLFDRRGGK